MDSNDGCRRSEWHDGHVSNIFTDFVRLYAWEGHEITPAEADWIVEQLLGDRGSYWVPVTIQLADNQEYVDIQYGGGKSVGIVDFWDDFGGQYDAMWVRAELGDGAPDKIFCGDPNDEWPYRSCAYGFDEVRVTAVADVEPDLSQTPDARWRQSDDRVWTLSTTGIYHCENSREDMDHAGPNGRAGKRAWQVPWPVARPGGLFTPTTPAYSDASFEVIQPARLGALVEFDDRWPKGYPGVESVEFFWRGRLVHRVRYEDDEMEGRSTWQHRSADWWDNCIDPAFVEFNTRRGGQY
jgi:hypothetical protein